MVENIEARHLKITTYSLIALAIFIVVGFVFFLTENDRYILSVVFSFWWLMLPIPLWKIFMIVWTEYSELMWAIKQKAILLEIKSPANTEKSPQIMESFFTGLQTYSGVNKFEKYCGWRPLQEKYTAEIVSTEGAIHFYLRCPEKSRNNVEAQIYAQYPDAEIFQADDYTKNIPRNLPNKDWDVWGSMMKLFRRNAFPIRSYREFKEDVTGTMQDPLASITEAMSLIGPGQHIWLQIIFSPWVENEAYEDAENYINEKTKKNVSKKEKTGFIRNFAGHIWVIFRNLVAPLFGHERDFTHPFDAPEEKKEEFNIDRLPPQEVEEMKAVLRKKSKLPFLCMIRFAYIGRRENYNKPLGVSGVLGAIKQLNDSNLNAILVDNDSKTYANYYFTQPRLLYRQRKIVEDYRSRAFAGKFFPLNTEELATIFHFPDQSVKASNIQRVEAKKGEAPMNLPIELTLE